MKRILRAIAATTCLLAVGLFPVVGAQTISAATAVVPLPRDARIIDALMGDVNGDGAADLAVAIQVFGDQKGRRLRIHFRRSEGPAFVPEPDRDTRLTPDVIGVSLADVSGDPGADLVLFNRTGAWVAPATPGRSARPRMILRAHFLWQAPGDEAVIPWTRGILDLNGDGLVDLLVPENSAMRVVFQTRAGEERRFESIHYLRLPLDPSDLEIAPTGARALQGRKARKTLELKVRVGDNGALDEGSMLEVSESVGVPQMVDWDGDGDLDLVARTVEKLHVWLQEPRGRFQPRPQHSLRIPVLADKERQLDISYSAHLQDLNGDSRSDCVLISGNQDAEQVRARVMVFIQGAGGRGARATTRDAPLFGPKGLPQQLIPLAGFAAVPHLTDVDGDQKPDLCVATFRPDLIDSLRSKSKVVDIGLHMFLNQGSGTFTQRADMNETLAIRASDLQSGQRYLTARFFADVTGDGVKDLLLQDGPTRVKVLSVRRHPKGFSLRKKALWSATLASAMQVRLAPAARGSSAELLLLGRSEIRHVRFP